MKVSKVLEAIKEELKQPLPEPRVVSTKKERKMAKKAKSKIEDEELDQDEMDDADESDEEDEGDEDEAPPAKSKGKAKKAAKPAKAAKSSKKAKAKDEDGFVSIQTLADEAGIGAQSARVKLRDSDLSKPEGGRWRWKENSKDLKAVRKALGL